MTTQEIKKTTHGSILLAAVEPADLKTLFEDARRCRFEAGQTIFTEGEAGNTVVLIESGRVEVSVTSLSGRKSVLAHMGQGEVLGEIAALDGGSRSADAIAASAVSGLVLTRQNILAFVADRPKVAQAIITELCRKVRNASDMFATQSVTEGSARLARALLLLFDKWGALEADGSLRLTERFSQSEIGEFSGLTRENVNRHIKGWVDRGLLVSDKRQLFLLDRMALQDIADG